jgi:WD40 repeat protein
MADAINFDKAALAWTLPWDADWITAVRFLGPTRRVAAGNNLGQILVWDLPEKAGGPVPAPVRRLDGHTNVISRLLSTADGRWLISASYDHTIRFWDLQAATKGNETIVLNARAIAEANPRAGRKAPPPLEVKVQTQQAVRVFEGHREWVTGLALSRDGTLLVSGDDGVDVIAWEQATGKELNGCSRRTSPCSARSGATSAPPIIGLPCRHHERPPPRPLPPRARCPRRSCSSAAREGP